ncbi:DUF1963 domain-containing protein [Actinomadura macrotermitis]|uniref:DUF1963 domain-containing protein n=1 Tax=Actinomadura macrotermitis TaxID=2585200 RepID=A0A7K0BP75_9ACTN|nr:YwqG family protein [Actinomadura macrotermitis]MQY02999.1 hypothetical protein [Actinomadura macrotermitis]
MEHFEVQRQRLRSLFGVFLSAEAAEELLPLARPALRLGADGAAGVRLGGRPMLPVDEPWPEWEGRPLDFLGSVDFAALSEMTAIPRLPHKGVAAFYYATATPRPWGDDPAQRDGWRLFIGDLSEADPPAGSVAFPECPLGAEPFLSMPSPRDPVLQTLENAYSGFLAVYEQLHAAWVQHVWPGGAPMHQLGGWPVLVQGAIGLNRVSLSGAEAGPVPNDGRGSAENSWNLLIQLDSDQRLDWFWGDPGRLYFCGREGDPVEQGWLTLQAT